MACSLECHENHDVYELYTKRNYRCDCGNSKFKPEFECKLMEKNQKKSSFNELNKYNHNFSGRYCVCDKRYPPDESDTSAEANDEMWQCIICEDWYHTKHLGTDELPTKFDEFICGPCVDKLDFVRFYNMVDLSEEEPSTSTSTKDENAEDDDDRTLESKLDKPDKSNAVLVKTEAETKTAPHVNNTEGSAKLPICESDTNDSQAENKDPDVGIATSKANLSSSCLLLKLKRQVEKNQGSSTTSSKPLFWLDCDWRSKLCRCRECLEMYKFKECEYLLDHKDTVQYYEAQGKALAKNIETPLERGMSALNRMNRAAVVEALHGYDELKANLSDYLRKFADTKKVVREEDIHEFFHQLKSKKKPRLEYE